MSYEYIRSTLEEYIHNNWNDTLIAVDNVEFTPPQTAWIRIGLRPFLAENASLGDLCSRYNAIFYIQVFTPLNEGPGEAYRLIEKLDTLLSNQTINKVHTYKADTTYIGDEGRGWFQLNFNVPCWYQI